MCGIIGGFWKETASDFEHGLKMALDCMKNRGPDDRGFDLRRNQHGVIALGHTRLSIIDLTRAGHQPMISRDHRYGIIFNGEIYNYREIRKELIGCGYNFDTQTDTEVLLCAWSEWGLKSLEKLDGMFAFAVHDRKENLLHCVRDAFGIKPLFYKHDHGYFIFGSVQNALLVLSKEKPKLNLQRCYDYLIHADYDSVGNTFIEGIKHIPAGHSVVVDLTSCKVFDPVRWWHPNIQERQFGSFDEASEMVRAHFIENVRLQLRSDVAVGAALSGGIDSSAVVCAMRYIDPSAEIKTFSYIATGSVSNEEKWANLVNNHTKANSFKVTAGPIDLLRDLDDMIAAQGEPFISTSIYAQYCVFRLAKQHGVTVTLDGQGADELLAGYSGYPAFRILSIIEKQGVYSSHDFIKRWSKWPNRSYKKGIMELGRILLSDRHYAAARSIMGRNFEPKWLNQSILENVGVSLNERRPVRDPRNRGRRVVEQLSKSLTGRGLPALLRHADRNSMRFSVESRVPFLTTKFAELLLSMPEEYLISRNGETKCIFRSAMRGIVPEEILKRRDKIGFETPEQSWLMQIAPELRKWITSYEGTSGLINKDALVKEFDKTVNGNRKITPQVWRWINFIRWEQLSSN